MKKQIYFFLILIYEFRMFFNVSTFFRDLYPNNQKIHLILDSQGSHNSKISQITVKDLNIDLYFIPSHFIDLLQSLDIAFLVTLKSLAKGKIRRLLFNIDDNVIGMPTSIKFIQQVRKELPDSSIERAWELYT